MLTSSSSYCPLVLAVMVVACATNSGEGDSTAQSGSSTQATTQSDSTTPDDPDSSDPEATSAATSLDTTADDGVGPGSTTAGMGTDSTTTGIECSRFLEGEIEGCDCYAFSGQGIGPFYCGGDLVCDAETTTCSTSMECDTVEPDAEPNDSPETAVDLGMICNDRPWQGQLEPGGSDWFTWRGFHPTAGCGDPGGVRTFNPDIEVCFYNACIDGLGDLGETLCGGTEVALADGTPGCCSPMSGADSLVAYDCPEGVEVWVELRNTTDTCIGYEAQLNL